MLLLEVRHNGVEDTLSWAEDSGLLVSAITPMQMVCDNERGVRKYLEDNGYEVISECAI